jgi:hypothetical protein
VIRVLTGIPGTGKTTVGDYLAREHDFEHFDFEHVPTLAHYLRSQPEQHGSLGVTLRRDRDIVITWGFVPDVQLPHVLFLRERGFDWIWFDGDRDAARRVFVKRGTVPEHLLDIQLQKIKEHIDLTVLKPRVINTFDSTGQFRPLSEIGAQLLEGSAHTRSAA